VAKLSVYPIVVLSLLVSLALGGAGSAAQDRKSGGPAPCVQLKCKIKPEPGEHSKSFWLLELRTAAGAPLRKVLRMAGDTVRFTNLIPGIYRIYLSGKGGRSSCESIDLTPGPNQPGAEFTKEIAVPESISAVSGRHQVSVHTLAIPKEAAQEMQRSEKYQLNGDEDRTIEHLKRAIEIYPQYAAAWNNLGACYHRKGDYEKSIQTFQKAIELNPEFYVGYVNLGGSLLAAGRFQEAAEASRKALVLSPDDAVTNSQLALSYYYLRDFPAAQRYFKRVVDLDPAFAPSPHRFLAQIAIADKSADEAVRYLHGYLALHPNAPDASQVKSTLALILEGELDRKF
jgi:Flp pilus assembly protein TadD